LPALSRIEVSGWDEDEIFFVEKSELSWDDFAGKHISLKHMLAEGALVFNTHAPAGFLSAFLSHRLWSGVFIGCDVHGSHRISPESRPSLATAAIASA